jgi:hypothetical protein
MGTLHCFSSLGCYVYHQTVDQPLLTYNLKHH